MANGMLCLPTTACLAALSVGLGRVPRPPPAIVERPSCCSTCSPALISSYSQATDVLLAEISGCEAGDRIDLSIYLLEAGASTEAVLAALLSAGARGVRVHYALDISYVSMISRLAERTTTLIPRAERMARAHPSWCSLTYRTQPAHSKYVIFSRAHGRSSSAVVGGINLGERFAQWQDFSIRLGAEQADELQQALLSAAASARCATWAEALLCRVADRGDVARATAVAAPITAAFTLVSCASAAAALLALPLAAAGVEPFGESAAAVAAAATTAALGCASLSLALGCSLGSSADGSAFSLPREIILFLRSLVFDRRCTPTEIALHIVSRRLLLMTAGTFHSWLGDRLAPLRSLWINGERRLERRELAQARLLPLPACSLAPVQLVANLRAARRCEVEPSFRAFFGDERLCHYRVAMAYLGHRWGVELLGLTKITPSHSISASFTDDGGHFS